MKRAMMALAAATAGALVLTGCVPDVPTAAEPAEMEQRAALVDTQVLRVIEETFAELEAADAEMDPDLLDVRVGGDAAEVRAAQYLSAGVDDGPALPVLPSQMQAVYVSGEDEWPRVMVGVSEQPDEETTPVVFLWVQEHVATPYQLQAWAHMIPGATLPAMPGYTTGAVQLSLGDDTVEPSPRSALEEYLELLREGGGSDRDEEFKEDTYRERLFAAREALSDAASEAGGDYIDTIQPKMAHTYAFATADGGSLVFAPVEIASSFSVDNAKVSVPDTDEPLVDGDLDDKVTHHYTDFVVIYVPGPGTGSERPAVVAADHNLVRVSDS